MKKILIIGKRGFIGNSLNIYLKKFYSVTHTSYKNLNRFNWYKCASETEQLYKKII